MSCDLNNPVHNSAFVECTHCLGGETVLDCVALVCMMWQCVLEGRGKNSLCWVKELCHGNDWVEGAVRACCSGLVAPQIGSAVRMKCSNYNWQLSGRRVLSHRLWSARLWTSSSKACFMSRGECTLLQHQGQVPSWCYSPNKMSSSNIPP